MKEREKSVTKNEKGKYENVREEKWKKIEIREGETRKGENK